MKRKQREISKRRSQTETQITRIRTYEYFERTNKNFKLSNELLKDGESELGSLTKAENVDKKKLLSASAKKSTSLKRCAELQSKKDQLSEKLMKLSEADS